MFLYNILHFSGGWMFISMFPWKFSLLNLVIFPGNVVKSSPVTRTLGKGAKEPQRSHAQLEIMVPDESNVRFSPFNSATAACKNTVSSNFRTWRWKNWGTDAHGQFNWFISISFHRFLNSMSIYTALGSPLSCIRTWLLQKNSVWSTNIREKKGELKLFL